ncbi:glycoside hydrolase family 28 protein [Pedobacter jamesrossensis]|uniref:Glycoside hydrolase family 28 protein n=1 Tax=Pedobacter jamesrossensis TaxID=1908238 RepID=A0ABV8NRM1_9SPHI
MRSFLLTSIILFLFAKNVNAQEFLITDYGAGKDSTLLSTAEIQKTIDDAFAKGGGTIVVPKGTFLVGALFFKKNTKLKLLKGAVLKGSDDIKQYPFIPSRMEGVKQDYFAALINAYKVDDFSINGPGEINGNGHKFWVAFWHRRDSLKKIGKETTNLEVHRPRLIFIWKSDNVAIKNVKLRNSGFWTTHLYQCNNVTIDSCDIRSPFKPVAAPSTDGVDLDVCKNVVISNCYISVNDDAIAIKGGKGPTAHKLEENGPVEDILIENCTFGPAHASVTLGSESIYVNNLTIRNCKVENDCPLLNLKMRPDTYQVFENIKVENISGRCGSIISIKPWKQFFDLGSSNEKPFGTVKNISISNINVSCQNLGYIQGNKQDLVSGIRIKNIKAVSKSNSFNTKYSDVKFENIVVNGKLLERSQLTASEQMPKGF